jgi:hypothetical protein
MCIVMVPAVSPASASAVAATIVATIASMMKTATCASQKVLRGIRPSKLAKNRISFMERRRRRGRGRWAAIVAA